MASVIPAQKSMCGSICVPVMEIVWQSAGYDHMGFGPVQMCSVVKAESTRTIMGEDDLRLGHLLNISADNSTQTQSKNGGENIFEINNVLQWRKDLESLNLIEKLLKEPKIKFMSGELELTDRDESQKHQ